MTTQAERMVNDTVNIGETERIVSAIVGGALTIGGLSRLSLGGLIVAGVGAALGYRAVTGHCPVYEKLGVRILRQAWLNTEWLWAGSFVMAGFVTLFS